MSHADDVQAVSVDEALVDVTTAVKQMPPSTKKVNDPAKELAEMLRAEIKSKTGCDGTSRLYLGRGSLINHYIFSEHRDIAQYYACSSRD